MQCGKPRRVVDRGYLHGPAGVPSRQKDAARKVEKPPMMISSRTPEGSPNRCPVCGHYLRIEPSIPPGDAPCPHCGSLLWFAETVIGDATSPLLLDAILPDLRAANKSEAIREIVEHLSVVGMIRRESVEEIVDAVLESAKLGSGGIGRGFAIPHARHRSVKRTISATAMSSRGVDFDSFDRRLVNVIFLIVSPIEGDAEQIVILERISRWMRTQHTRA